MTEESEIIIINEAEQGERLDKILAQRYQKQSRTYFQYLIEEHLVLLNGEPVKKRVKPSAGDEVEVEFALSPEINLNPEPIPLNILYEDDYLLAVNKPAGMVVHPAPGNWSGTFVNALLYHCKNLSLENESLRPGIVHRLDKDTSGVLLAAKTTLIQQKLVEIFSERKIYKEYLAICLGNPGECEINAPIGRHPIHRKLMAIVPDGRQALSYVKSLSSNSKFSIVKVVIATGRTHQIRVHLKSHGSPVLGDSLYGSAQTNQINKVDRQLLHALKLRFTHPITHQVIEVVAPPPKDMERWLKKIDPKWEKLL